MRKWFVLLLFASCLLLAGCQSALPSKSVPSYPGYTLVFADEFEGKVLNPDNWTHEVGDRWHNNEQQAYTARPENSYVQDGNLVIVARREAFHGRSFTSARIISKHKQDFLYGRIEASIQLPRGGGMWPAFWMMPSDDAYGQWAASGEIDIMEARNTPMEIRGNLHFGGRWPNNTSSRSSAYSDGSDFSQDFHLYSMEWDPGEIRWYCDNKLYKTVNRWWTGGKEDNGTFPAPFDKRFYILLNVAVGGNYVRCLEPECITADLPQQMTIDFVRVYQKQ
jgi:beta-glucanase (GH16 family)